MTRFLPLLTLLAVLGCAPASDRSAVPGAVDPGPVRGSPRPPPGAFTATVDRVVDGDTFVARVAGRRVRVRLIGVDTPETVRPHTRVACFGPQASAFAKRLLPRGALLWVAYQPGGRVDRFGRDLWDVWLPDGRWLAGVLVAAGAARAFPVAPQLEHAALLDALAAGARGSGRGLWGPPCHGESFSDM